MNASPESRSAGPVEMSRLSPSRPPEALPTPRAVADAIPDAIPEAVPGAGQFFGAHYILLGASNVTLGLPWILHGLRTAADAPARILAAHGHGRSYGLPSWAPFRTLPGILDCGLWRQAPAAERSPVAAPGASGANDPARRGNDESASPTNAPVPEFRTRRMPTAPPVFALLTDVGNDLLYGRTPAEILGWVNECCRRLIGCGARLTIGRLPRGALERVGRWRFAAVQHLFFPRSRLSYSRMRDSVEQLDGGLADLAAAWGAASFVPAQQWYGFDPIHILRRRRAQAWSEILSLWERPSPMRPAWPGLRRGLHDWRATAAERRVFGALRCTPQPVRRWREGVELWLY